MILTVMSKYDFLFSQKHLPALGDEYIQAD